MQHLDQKLCPDLFFDFPPQTFSLARVGFSSSLDLWVLNPVIYSTEAKSKRNHALLVEIYPAVVEIF